MREKGGQKRRRKGEAGWGREHEGKEWSRWGKDKEEEQERRYLSGTELLRKYSKSRFVMEKL